MEILLILFLASGTLFIGLSIPLIQRKIPPNPLYGFRVRRTLEDPNVWYLANAYSGWRLLWLGSAILVTAVVGYLVPGLDVGQYGTVVGIVTGIGLDTMLVQCFRYLRKLTEEKSQP